MSPRTSNFRLVGEQLESRFALSTLLGGVVEPLPIEPVAPTGTTEVSLPETNPPPTDPPPVDPPLAVQPPDSTNPPIPTNAAPIIHDFVLSIVNNWCTLTGWVSDDQDPTGYLVTLTGVLNEVIEVGADDHFTFGFEYNPELHGPVYALTYDLLGFSSNEPVVNI